MICNFYWNILRFISKGHYDCMIDVYRIYNKTMLQTSIIQTYRPLKMKNKIYVNDCNVF